MLVALVSHHMYMNSLTPVSFDHHPELPHVVNAISDYPILNRPWVPSADANAPPHLLWMPLKTGEDIQMPQLKK